MSEGTAHIRWKKESTHKVSQEVKEKHENALSLGISWERENDLLSACLGSEQSGRVRGMSSYNGWKYVWPEFSGMCRKRKRIGSVDVEAIKAELRAEVTQDIISMLASQGLQLQPISRGPSPAPGRRSSCAFVSGADNHAEADPMQLDTNLHAELDTTNLQDTIDLLTETTPCSLVATRGGYQMEEQRVWFIHNKPYYIQSQFYLGMQWSKLRWLWTMLKILSLYHLLMMRSAH